jgi:Flp pilus assembly protein TadG
VKAAIHASQGQTLVMFALVMALFFAGMIALVSDVGAVFVDYNRADDSALLAAQSGASAIDPDAFREGILVLDQPAARARCRSSIERSGMTGDCSVTPQRVTAELVKPVSVPIPLAGFNAVVHVKRSAIPVFGGSSPIP